MRKKCERIRQKSKDENRVGEDKDDDEVDEEYEPGYFVGGVKAVHFIYMQYTPPDGPNGPRSLRYGAMLAEDYVPGAEPT